MNHRQDHILQVLSSIAVGAMAFCLKVLAAMLLGIILFAPWVRSDRLFSPQSAILSLVSVAAGVVAGGIVGKKYYRDLKKNSSRFTTL